MLHEIPKKMKLEVTLQEQLLQMNVGPNENLKGCFFSLWLYQVEPTPNGGYRYFLRFSMKFYLFIRG